MAAGPSARGSAVPLTSVAVVGPRAFHDTLLEACFRQKDAGRVGRLLAERLARRRDQLGVNRTAAA